MASKNPFSLLEDFDPEEEQPQPVEDKKKQVKQDKKKEKAPAQPSKPAEPQEKAPQKKDNQDRKYGERVKKAGPRPGYSYEYQVKDGEQKEGKHEKGAREGPKPFKGVPAEPHPLDKHSGTGRGKEVSKGGAGRRNWGTYEDDLKKEEPAEKVEETQKEGEAEPEAEKKEEEVPQITLEEYFNKKNIKHEKQNVDFKPPVKKIDPNQQKVDNLEVVKSRELKNLEDEKIKTKLKDNNYKVAFNSENKDLLGFQTGAVYYDSSRKKGGNKPFREQRDEKEKTESVPVQEGEAKPEEEEPHVEEAQENKGRGRGSRRGGRGGNRGGRREGYENKGHKEVIVNIENMKDFPALG